MTTRAITPTDPKPIVPLPEGYCKRFPPELWVHIFSYLTHCNDVIHVALTNKFFTPLMMKTANQTLCASLPPFTSQCEATYRLVFGKCPDNCCLSTIQNYYSHAETLNHLLQSTASSELSSTHLDNILDWERKVFLLTLFVKTTLLHLEGLREQRLLSLPAFFSQRLINKVSQFGFCWESPISSAIQLCARGFDPGLMNSVIEALTPLWHRSLLRSSLDYQGIVLRRLPCFFADQGQTQKALESLLAFFELTKKEGRADLLNKTFDTCYSLAFSLIAQKKCDELMSVVALFNSYAQEDPAKRSDLFSRIYTAIIENLVRQGQYEYAEKCAEYIVDPSDKREILTWIAQNQPTIISSLGVV